MKFVIFGLAVSSSWGNGHATLWRGLCAALARTGHRVVFFERDVCWYAEHRDLTELPGGRLVIYRDWADVLPDARRELAGADVAIVTSYCPDGIAATGAVLDSGAAVRAFYDLDTPVTLARVAAGETVDYLGPRGLRDFDLVLSYTGGASLAALRDVLSAKCAAPLYGSVDPAVHRPGIATSAYRADLAYLGTFAPDRQAALESLFVEPARRQPERRFLLAGACYPPDFPWTANMSSIRHLPPAEHAAFFASCRLTLNVTRAAMARTGWCPSGRLFEAAACGAPILSDSWNGIEDFLTPGEEIVVAETTADVEAALELDDAELRRIAAAARARVLAEHTADHRARELVDRIEWVRSVPAALAAGA